MKIHLVTIAAVAAMMASSIVCADNNIDVTVVDEFIGEQIIVPTNLEPVTAKVLHTVQLNDDGADYLNVAISDAGSDSMASFDVAVMLAMHDEPVILMSGNGSCNSCHSKKIEPPLVPTFSSNLSTKLRLLNKAPDDFIFSMATVLFRHPLSTA